MPGGQFRVGDAVDEQIGLARLRAAVVRGEAAPGQASVIGLARLEGCRARRKSAFDQGLAVVADHLHVDAEVFLALLKKCLGGARALFLVALCPGLGQAIQGGMPAENPGVLVQRAAEQHGQPGNQGDGQPEAGEDAPEQ
ncbi:hypothetical protein D9M68_739070 [compost metagenome]